MGTAALRDPRAPERVVRDLGRWCERHGVRVGRRAHRRTGVAVVTRARAIVALDVPNAAEADALLERSGRCGLREGRQRAVHGGRPGCGGRRAAETGSHGSDRDVFLDLKRHDIPNTVRNAAARRAAALDVRLVTVHTTGGRAMLEAAVEGAGESCGRARRDGAHVARWRRIGRGLGPHRIRRPGRGRATVEPGSIGRCARSGLQRIRGGGRAGGARRHARNPGAGNPARGRWRARPKARRDARRSGHGGCDVRRDRSHGHAGF